MSIRTEKEDIRNTMKKIQNEQKISLRMSIEEEKADH